MITQEQLKEALHYNSDTGDFTRLKATSNNTKAGDVAGSLTKNGYIEIRIYGERYLGHRLALLYVDGRFPESHTDHIDGDKENNRIENLRSASCSENSRNTKLYKNNKSGVMGVNYDIARLKWAVRIMNLNKNLHLGRFVDKFEAICARKSAEIKYGYHENHGRTRPKIGRHV